MQIYPGFSGSNAKQLASVAHMMQFSAESPPHSGVHQRGFASWLGSVPKERADNCLRKGAATRALAHTAFPLSNPHGCIILASIRPIEFTRLRVDALVDRVLRSPQE